MQYVYVCHQVFFVINAWQTVNLSWYLSNSWGKVPSVIHTETNHKYGSS